VLTASGPRMSSAAWGVQSSLEALMVVIRSTQLHFIRCIKPNEQKAAFVFEPVQVLQQVRRAFRAQEPGAQISLPTMHKAL